MKAQNNKLIKSAICCIAIIILGFIFIFISQSANAFACAEDKSVLAVNVVDGVSDNIIEISTAAELFQIAEEDNNGKNFMLQNDIDLGVDTSWHDSISDWEISGWLSLDSSRMSDSVFDGGGYTIQNLHISRSIEYSGLFSKNSLDIKNLFVKYADVVGAENSGVLAGKNSGRLSNVHIVGDVSAESVAGGLVGENYGDLDNCLFIGSVISRMAGGLIAINNCAATTNSFSLGSVSGQKIGGLVSTVYKSNSETTVISDCFAL